MEKPAAEEAFTFTTYFDESAKKPLPHERPLAPSHSANAEQRRKEDETAAAIATGAGGESRWTFQNAPAWVAIACWIFTSGAVILQNKYILANLGFSHPIALTTIHLTFQTIATRILRNSTTLIDGAKELEATGKMNRDVYIRKIVPVGVLFSLSLVLSNWVYLRLTVSFIQVHVTALSADWHGVKLTICNRIKAFSPVCVLLIAFIMRLKEPSRKLFAIVCTICLGVAIASYGEIQFELIGFLVQLFAILIESSRITLIEILLKGMGMNALTSLYYFAPVCLVVNAVILLPVEGFAPFYDAVNLVGLPFLFGNACMTFALNLSSVWLIGKASGLVLTLSGVGKDILLITGSWFLLGSTITPTQIFGYAVALAGLMAFKLS